jgi:hypothetical protein
MGTTGPIGESIGGSNRPSRLGIGETKHPSQEVQLVNAGKHHDKDEKQLKYKGLPKNQSYIKPVFTKPGADEDELRGRKSTAENFIHRR